MECNHYVDIKIGVNKIVSYCTKCGEILKVHNIPIITTTTSNFEDLPNFARDSYGMTEQEQKHWGYGDITVLTDSTSKVDSVDGTDGESPFKIRF